MLWVASLIKCTSFHVSLLAPGLAYSGPWPFAYPLALLFPRDRLQGWKVAIHLTLSLPSSLPLNMAFMCLFLAL